jgi:hypothetical protein
VMAAWRLTHSGRGDLLSPERSGLHQGLVTPSKFYSQQWFGEDKKSFEVYRGSDGHYYRLSDDSLVN